MLNRAADSFAVAILEANASGVGQAKELLRTAERESAKKDKKLQARERGVTRGSCLVNPGQILRAALNHIEWGLSVSPTEVCFLLVQSWPFARREQMIQVELLRPNRLVPLSPWHGLPRSSCPRPRRGSRGCCVPVGTSYCCLRLWRHEHALSS